MGLLSDVQFQGRWDLERENRYTTHWCGSSLRFQTTSRSVILQLGDLTASRRNYHNVLWYFGCQSVTRTALVKGKRAMVITPTGTGSSSSNGGEILRDVTVMLCDWGAILQILDINAEDERPIITPTIGSPKRPLLFIGDSLVSGFSPPLWGIILPHGSFQSFGSIAVRSLRALGLDARLEMVAYAGICLMSTSHKKGMEDVFWDGINGTGGWEERSRDAPKDIFVCIGTNDRALGWAKDEFLRNYKAFLVRLRDSYPESLKRIHVISPFGFFNDTSDPRSRVFVFEPDVQYMVEELAQSWHDSDPNGVRLHHIVTDGWIDKSLTCDGLHPTAEGHEIIGAKLVEYLDAHGLV